MENRHIENVAQNLIGKLGITWKEVFHLFHGDSRVSPQALYESRNKEIRRALKRMRPETLGKIAAQGLAHNDPRTERQLRPSGVTDEGKTSMYAVHCGNFVGKYDSGHDALIELALTAIVAEMADILDEKMQLDVDLMQDTTEGM
jgi:hypothetical protein